MLYEMLRGERPFSGPTARAIVARSMSETPEPLTRSRAEVTPALEATIGKVMAGNPGSGSPRRGRSLLAGAMAVAIVVSVMFLRRTPSAAAAGIQLAVLPFENRGALGRG